MDETNTKCNIPTTACACKRTEVDVVAAGDKHQLKQQRDEQMNAFEPLERQTSEVEARPELGALLATGDM